MKNMSYQTRRIKKNILVIVFLLLISMLTGCSAEIDTSPEYNAETDFNAFYDDYGYGSKMIGTEDGYYYTTSEKFLHFIDKKTMRDIPVCSKLECSHTIDDAEVCAAYRGGMYVPEELFYYDGKLYGFIEESAADVIGRDGVYLCEISLDGTYHKKIWELDWKGGSSGDYYSGVLHRGVLYFSTSGNNNISVYAYDLETKKCKCIYDNPDRSGQKLTAVGNYLYWSFFEEVTENGEALEPMVMRYEISTGKINEMKGLQRCFAGTDKMYFERYDHEQGKRFLCYTGRDGSDFVETEMDLAGTGHADDKYIYAYPYQGTEDTTVNVYDIHTLELVAELNVAEQLQDVPPAQYVIPGDGDEIFLYNFTRSVIYYAYKSAIGTPDFQWYEVEKIN